MAGFSMITRTERGAVLRDGTAADPGMGMDVSVKGLPRQA
jgi:hypothetical protein